MAIAFDNLSRIDNFEFHRVRDSLSGGWNLDKKTYPYTDETTVDNISKDHNVFTVEGFVKDCENLRDKYLEFISIVENPNNTHVYYSNWDNEPINVRIESFSVQDKDSLESFYFRLTLIGIRNRELEKKYPPIYIEDSPSNILTITETMRIYSESFYTSTLQTFNSNFYYEALEAYSSYFEEISFTSLQTISSVQNAFSSFESFSQTISSFQTSSTFEASLAFSVFASYISSQTDINVVLTIAESSTSLTNVNSIVTYVCFTYYALAQALELFTFESVSSNNPLIIYTVAPRILRLYEDLYHFVVNCEDLSVYTGLTGSISTVKAYVDSYINSMKIYEVNTTQPLLRLAHDLGYDVFSDAPKKLFEVNSCGNALFMPSEGLYYE